MITNRKSHILNRFNIELKEAKKLYESDELERAFYHLERAHILGQAYIIPHTVSHLWMLKIGVRKKDLKEILGQAFRISTGILGSAFGVLPKGNTGGSNVNPFRSMDIPEDLKSILLKEEK